MVYIQKSVKSGKHSPYGHLAETVQKVHKIMENAKFGFTVF